MICAILFFCVAWRFTRKNDVGPFIDEEDDGYTGGYIGWEAICYSVLEAGEPDPDSPGESPGWKAVIFYFKF